jgi:hypothetical protein
MKQNSVFRAVLNLALVSATGLLVACGSDSSTPAPAPTDASISGIVAAAPVSGASVLVKDTSGNELADAVTTAADGSYSVTLSGTDFTGELVFEASGGTYDDEATGGSTTAGTLSAYVDVASLTGTDVQITPASTIVHDMIVDHGVDLATALAAFDEAFGFDANEDAAPADATAPVADATEEELLAGLRAAAFSQLTADLGLTADQQFDLLAALAEDLADGALDGEGASGAVMITATDAMPVDIQNRFVTALTNFHNDGLMGDTSGNDMTGLDNSQIGMLPFAKVALTSLTSSGAYKVVYEPGTMDAMQGRTDFTLKITDDSGKPVSASGNPPVELDLMMYMSDRKHSTPDLDCEEYLAGEYVCTVYYVMPSVMATGDSMGFWQINVTVDSKTAVFYPKVMMAMGDTTRVLLKGIAPDTIPMMGEQVSRPYNLFRNKLSSNPAGGHDFELFIAPMETMTSFPALEVGDTLNITFDVNDVEVKFSTNPTDASSWKEATNVGFPGTGRWGIVGLTGLTDGVEGKIYVKLSVDDDSGFPGTFDDDELKTTNGLDGDAGANDPSNEYQFFTVTP